MSRRHCLTERVETDFGTLFAQIDIDDSGKVIGLNIAAHYRQEDSAVNKLLLGLSQTLRDMLDCMNGSVLNVRCLDATIYTPGVGTVFAKIQSKKNSGKPFNIRIETHKPKEKTPINEMLKGLTKSFRRLLRDYKK